MKICLAGPPTVEHITRENFLEHNSARSVADRIPLGILTLASSLQRNAFDCRVVDLNRMFLDYIRENIGSQNFFDYAMEVLTGTDFDILGLGTMCGSYLAILKIATAIKAIHPQTVIVL